MLNIVKKRSSRASKASNMTIKSEPQNHLDFDVLFEMMKKLQEKIPNIIQFTIFLQLIVYEGKVPVSIRFKRAIKLKY